MKFKMMHSKTKTFISNFAGFGICQVLLIWLIDVFFGLNSFVLTLSFIYLLLGILILIFRDALDLVIMSKNKRTRKKKYLLKEEFVQKTMNNVLDKINYKYNNDAFFIVRKTISKKIKDKTGYYLDPIELKMDLERWMSFEIIKVISLLLMSGNYPLVVLNEKKYSYGNALILLYDDVMNYLVETGAYSLQEAQINKRNIRIMTKNNYK